MNEKLFSKEVDELEIMAEATRETLKPKTKIQIKRLYVLAQIGLSEALTCLMFDHNMSRGQALLYLGL